MKYLIYSTTLMITVVQVIVFAAQSPRSASQLLEHAVYLADLYNWVDAGPEFAQAERLFLAIGDDKRAFYARLGRMRSTLSDGPVPKVSAQLASELEKNPYLQSDKNLRMFCLIIKGDLDEYSDHIEMARDWRQVNALARELHDQKWEFRSLAEMGVAAFYSGNIELARKNVGTALMSASRIGDIAGQARELGLLSNGLLQAKMYDQAIAYSDKAVAVAKKNPDSGYPYVLIQFKLEALIGLRDFDHATTLASEMLSYAREKHKPSLEAQVRGLFALMAQARSQPLSAVRQFQEAIRISARNGLVTKTSELEAMLSSAYLDQGDLVKAERSASLAAQSAQLSGDLSVISDRLQVLARVQAAQGKYERADLTYDRASAFVESMVARSGAADDKTSLIAAASDVYSQHFALLAERLHNASKAYSTIESVRGRVMTDLLLGGAMRSESADKFERRASQVRLQLATARSTQDIHRINDELFMIEQSRWIAPDITIRKTKDAITLKEVQQNLPAQTLILEYVESDPRSYCLVISHTGVRVVTLAATRTINEKVRAFIQSIEAKQLGRPEAEDLYRILLGSIPEVENHEHLIVVRDGSLYLLPFDSLVDSTGRYVAETHVVGYAPSATSYYLLQQQWARSRQVQRNFFGVGGIPYEQSSLQAIGVTRGYSPSGFANLPGSKEEVESAAAAIAGDNNTILVGQNATESAIKKASLDRYLILHLAVHGLASRKQPDGAALVLLSDPAQGEDGFLQAAEIVHLRLKADLVVLSACETAVGPVQGEEGMATLARAFFIAGANAVLATLWPVDDSASLLLMKRFYAHLGAGIPPSSALAFAKRDILHEFSRKAPPYYWAGYTFEGADSSALQSRSRIDNGHFKNEKQSR